MPAIEMAVSRFAEIGALDTEVGTLGDRLEVRKLLDRAKGLLQSRARADRAARRSGGSRRRRWTGA